MPTPEEKPSSSSTIALLISNGLTLATALVLKWPLATVLWPYWIQSVIIGWYARKRMLALKNFSTDGFTSNGQRVPEDENGKRSTAIFFVLHFGIFHAVYFMFLATSTKFTSPWDFFWIVVCGISYIYAQRKTFKQQVASDALGKPNLGTLMFLPYIRIVPMHLTIVLGIASGSTIGLLIFMPLKTLADILLDIFDRRSSGRTKTD